MTRFSKQFLGSAIASMIMLSLTQATAEKQTRPQCVESIGSPSEMRLSVETAQVEIPGKGRTKKDGTVRYKNEPNIVIYFPDLSAKEGESVKDKWDNLMRANNGVINLVLWNNGAGAVLKQELEEGAPCDEPKKSCAYKELIEHWVSYGFVVAAEHSDRLISLDHKIPTYVAGKVRPFLADQGAKEIKLFVAGKSRGGHMAAAYTHEHKNDALGVICIGGCSLWTGAAADGLYITGEEDWVPKLHSPAHRYVRRAYKAGVTPKQKWERDHIRCIDSNGKEQEYGTHMSQDTDPLIRHLTTDWLRCKANDDCEACDFLNEFYFDKDRWGKDSGGWMAIDKDPEQSLCSRSAQAQ